MITHIISRESDNVLAKSDYLTSQYTLTKYNTQYFVVSKGKIMMNTFDFRKALDFYVSLNMKNY